MASLKSTIIIDGGILEGGGQILRIVSALSSIFKIPMTIKNIRSNRSIPGLRPQHRSGLQLLKDMCDGKFHDIYVKSKQVTLIPHNINGGDFFADSGTAGSISLLIQSILPVSLYASGPCSFILKGGTDVDFAPTLDFTIEVFGRIANKFGINHNIMIKKRGFYPKGGGEVKVDVFPLVGPLKPITMLDRGEINTIRGVCFVAGEFPKEFCDDMESLVVNKFNSKIPENCKHAEFSIDIIKFKETNSIGNMAAICLWAETTTGCILGSSDLWRKDRTRSKSDHEMAMNAAIKASELLIKEINLNVCLDQQAQDQVILLMALAKGKSTIRISEPTMHTKTAIHFVEELTQVRFIQTKDPKDGTFLLECIGLGHT